MTTLTVNGKVYKAEVDPEMPLLWVLRDVLGLTGTKFGCGMGQCWGCTVLVAGKARPSCTIKAEAVAGQEITTIEGIPWDHPVKRAWVEEQVPQCGYCQPGQILRAVALLNATSDPSEEQIAKTMQRNLCRCGTYRRIEAAVKRAAKAALSEPAVGGARAGGPSMPCSPAGEKGFLFNPFVRIDSDGVVTVIAKHLETGQGIYTGLATLVAEELSADWSKVQVESAPADERVYNNLLFGPLQATGGSTSIANSYEQYRQAGAMARAMLIAAAAKSWSVPAGELTVAKGVVHHPPSSRQATFGELAQRAAGMTPPVAVQLKDPHTFELIGRQNTRLDIESKVQGAACYALDVRLPDMLTAVVARPPYFGGKVKTFDATRARAIPDVTAVVEIPEGVAVVAANSWAARQGRDALDIEWDDSGAELRSTTELVDEYRALLDTPGRPAAARGDVAGALARAAQTVEADFQFPYLAHAPLEPLNCVVQFTDNGCEIWAGDQFQTVDQANAAAAAGLDPRSVQIHTLFSGGSFGRRANPTSDYIVEGVHVAKALGGRVPIHLVWTREDDLKGGRYRPMYVHRVRAGLDARGNLVAWHHRLVGQSLLANTPFEGAMIQDGIDASSVEGVVDMPYAVDNFAVDLHTMQVGVPVLWWRSVGHTHTAFAVQVFLDEVAKAAGRDPIGWRRSLLQGHPRHLQVLELAAQKSGWGASLPPGHSRGVAVHKSFGTYVAQVAEIAMADEGTFRVERVVCAIDCGTIINPAIVRAQMEGGIALGLSAALGESVTLDGGRVEQANFNDYPVLRCPEMPRVEVHIVPSTEQPTGVGEPGVPPIAPAVANAVFAATGRRFRSLPLPRTPGS